MSLSNEYILLLLMVGSVTAPAAGCQETAAAHGQISSFVGCYDLKVGQWRPWSLGEDSIFVTPPRKIQLSDQRGTQGFEKSGFVVRTLPDASTALNASNASHRKIYAYWEITSPNQVELTWTDGLSGVMLSLKKHGEVLRGSAHPHFDFPTFPPRRMHVTARRVACPP